MRTSTAHHVQEALAAKASPAKAKASARFFKTGAGHYGEGDTFWGITVPEQRIIAKQHCNIPLSEIAVLLHSTIHEQRLTALHILVYQFKKANDTQKQKIFNFYLKNTQYINNWDLVDTSARDIVGAYMIIHPQARVKLYKLVRSKNLWERRISIIATHAFIQHQDFTDTLALGELLLHDTEDLMHKALGWTLREIGKRDRTPLIAFLQKFKTIMPRTALRYAIEHFPAEIRKSYLAK